MGLLTAGVAGLVLLAGAGVPPVPWRSAGADLSVRITVAPQVAQPGHWLTYRVRVRNSGPGDAVLPVLTVNVPGDVDIKYVDVAACHPGATRNEVVCPSDADIPSGGSGELTVLGKVRASARGPLRAGARLTSDARDGNEVDNHVELVTRIAPARLANRPRPEVRRTDGVARCSRCRG
ncbi:hypothetical protein GCM10009677_39390 [Sphaerisporangium rubeum]|uniref:Putative repeat protein (TIGR01451 family) n=1 Tax=Sphaerisporangium rubeum TaxID=321317 RepID=A0A7X0IDZ4_9ACTN|nr:DUF11 domain-containing protein [Sphaerisporangium rubeum]MBB6471927.1 putative repeat protein (TIGR01451 family) [Sphaerisporangium rubeum]